MAMLILVGGFTIVSILIWMLKNKGPTVQSIVVVMLGFAMVGVGGFGPSFIHDYVELVDALNMIEQTAENPDKQKEVAKRIVNEYADGAYEQDDWWLISATLKQYAVPDLDQILEQAAREVTTPARRDAIMDTQRDVLRYQDSLDAMLSAELSRVDSDLVPNPDTAPQPQLQLLDDRTLRTIRNNPKLLRDQSLFRIDEQELEQEFRRRQFERPTGP